LSNVAVGLDSQLSSIEGAADVATGAWSGVASTMFADHCDRLCNDARAGSSALRRAGDALHGLASEIEYAQSLARESQSLAASAASLRAQVATMEPSPLIRVATEEAYAVSSRALALEAEADRIAREAGARAAAVLSEVEGAAPSRRDLAWAGVMRLSASDLAAYLRMDVLGLPDRVQEAAGRRLAQLVRAATEGEEWDTEQVAELVDLLADNGYDGDFAAGFFNDLTGAATLDLVHQLQHHFGRFSDESERITTPLSIALGAATRSGRLDGAFIDDLMRTDGYEPMPVDELAQLVEHGTYEADFILRIGEQLVHHLAYIAVPYEGAVPGEELDVYSVIFRAIARTPEAARGVLLMDLPHPTPHGFESAMQVLLAGDYYGPDSGAGALIRAATIGSLGEDPAEANQVVLRLIQQSPGIHGEWGLPTDAVQAVADVAAAWWKDLSSVAYAAFVTDADAAGLIFGGQAHGDVSLADTIAFLEIGVSDPEGRETIVNAMNLHSEALIAEILAMPEGHDRDLLVHRLGATVEMFSIADSEYRELRGAQTDEFNEQMRELTGLLTGQLANLTGPLSRPLGYAGGKLLDELFESQEQLLEVKAGGLQDLMLRTQLELAMIAEAHREGMISDDQRGKLNDYVLEGSAYNYDRVRDVIEPIELIRRSMDELRKDWLQSDPQVRERL
jgi:hypothetical protein